MDEQLSLAMSPQVFFEYYDVLTQEENLKLFGLTPKEIENVLDLLALLAQQQSIYFLLRPNLPDESDNIFVECAFASRSRYLITSNIRNFRIGELVDFEFELITPAQCYKVWESRNE